VKRDENEQDATEESAAVDSDGEGAAGAVADDAAPETAAQADEPVEDAPRLVVPPWIQLVCLPLFLVFAWVFAGAASHAVFVFLVAGLISLLLNPIVRHIAAWGMPRSVAVLVVFGAFAAVLVVGSILLVDTGVTEVQQLREHLPQYTKTVEHNIDGLQRFLDHRHTGINLRDQGTKFLRQIEQKSSDVSSKVLDVGRNFVTSLASAIFNLVLVVVVTVYMLLDAPRIGRAVSGLLPRGSHVSVLYGRLEHALVRYVIGQVLASAVMGVSATIGLWAIGVSGLWSGSEGLAPVFGLIVGLTEFAPSIGPVVGAIPAVIAAAFSGVTPVIAVVIFFVVLHQLEGHVVVPRLMGAAIAVHPLLVIFGVVAAAQLFGVLGVLLVLPVLAVGREIVVFALERLRLQEWDAAADVAVAVLGADEAGAPG
jgi:predicted PurR-regulated permease PerM